MRKIVVLIGMLAALCGCGKQNDDSAKIEDLSRKLDLVMSNQTLISARLSSLPTVNDMNSMSYFYFSNSVTSLKTVHSEMSSLAEMSQLGAKLDLEGFSNVLSEMIDIKNDVSDIQDSQKNAQDSLRQINWDTSGTWFLMTNKTSSDPIRIETEADIMETKSQVDDMKDDMDKIKQRLGVQ